MNITKRTSCILTVYKDDAVSNVLVTNEYASQAEMLGFTLKNDVPTIICSHLYIKGGTVINVSIKNGGSVTVESGKLDGVSICRGGRLDLGPKAKATRVMECGGAVYCCYPWTMTDDEIKNACQFMYSDMYISELTGTVTLHENTKFHNLIVGKNAFIELIGGTIEHSTFDGCSISLRYGSLIDCAISNATVNIDGGCIGNVVFKSGCIINIGVLEDDARFICDNVTIASGCKIIRHHISKGDGSFNNPNLDKFIIDPDVTIEEKYFSNVLLEPVKENN